MQLCKLCLLSVLLLRSQFSLVICNCLGQTILQAFGWLMRSTVVAVYLLA